MMDFQSDALRFEASSFWLWPFVVPACLPLCSFHVLAFPWPEVVLVWFEAQQVQKDREDSRQHSKSSPHGPYDRSVSLSGRCFVPFDRSRRIKAGLLHQLAFYYPLNSIF